MHMGEKKARRSDVRKLVDRARRGDSEAFEALIGSCRSKILYLALHYAGNADDAEDCAQEAVLKAYRGIGKLKDLDAFDSWLHSIVKYTCYRRNGAMERDTILIGGDPGANDAIMSIEEARTEFLPAKYAEDAEKRSFVLERIKELNENYQEALLLFYFEGFSYKEIAATLGVNANKVTNDLKRARQALRKKIEEANGGAVLASAMLPAGAMPTLARIYELDCSHLVTVDMERRLMEYAGSVCAVTSVAGVGAAAAAGQGVAAKLAIGGASVLLVAGIATGVVVSGEPAESVADTPALVQPVEEPTEPPEREPEPVVDEPPAEAPIATLADMIGSDGEERLLALASQGGSGPDVASFVESLGAAQQGYAETLEGSLFAVYELIKQDKQLFVIVKAIPGTEAVEVAYRFGGTGPVPDMFEFVSMFDR